MVAELLLAAIILMLCIIANNFSGKFGMPALILFIGIGMLFGSDGIVKIPFDNFQITESICTIALGFIMFYGGFNTKWKAAKPVAVKSLLLSTVGVFLTAILTTAFCCIVLKFSFSEGFLLGAVISCTDAASVFSILRQKKLNLKDGVASLLEIESGSNDPTAYMLTVVGISLVNGQNLSSIPYAIFAQVVYGIAIGVALAYLGVFVLTKTKFVLNGLDTVFILALILFGLGLSSLVGGNGFLCIYLLGILLGLLAFPHKLPQIMVTAVLIGLFLLFIARPVTIFLLLKPFKCSVNQCLLVSWAGLRGASSIVFSIIAMAAGNDISRDLFHIVFMISLMSVAVQGTLLPFVSKKLDMIDDKADVCKTFNDYQEESAITLMRMYIPKGHNWENKLIKRNDENIIPDGKTVIEQDDVVVLYK
ncbi:MAG: cation:proton antiporter [Lachnospira sp.]|nr:cation:proton antiporter [Lachnospira sp.]